MNVSENGWKGDTLARACVGFDVLAGLIANSARNGHWRAIWKKARC
jgi:hypothetical protein